MTTHELHLTPSAARAAAPRATTRRAATADHTTRSRIGSRRWRRLLRSVGPLGPTPSERVLQQLDLPPTLRR